jgi:hypothetical protein
VALPPSRRGPRITKRIFSRAFGRTYYRSKFPAIRRTHKCSGGNKARLSSTMEWLRGTTEAARETRENARRLNPKLQLSLDKGAAAPAPHLNDSRYALQFVGLFVGHEGSIIYYQVISNS